MSELGPRYCHQARKWGKPKQQQDNILHQARKWNKPKQQQENFNKRANGKNPFCSSKLAQRRQMCITTTDLSSKSAWRPATVNAAYLPIFKEPASAPREDEIISTPTCLSFMFHAVNSECAQTITGVAAAAVPVVDRIVIAHDQTPLHDEIRGPTSHYWNCGTLSSTPIVTLCREYSKHEKCRWKRCKFVQAQLPHAQRNKLFKITLIPLFSPPHIQVPLDYLASSRSTPRPLLGIVV